MKRIILLLTVAILSATVVFAQNTAKKKTASAATTEMKSAAVSKTQADKNGTLHYSFSHGRLTNCMGNRWNAQLEDVKLKNGTIVTRKGVIKYRNGTFGQLQDGQCIDLAGQVTDHKQAHAATADM